MISENQAELVLAHGHPIAYSAFVLLGGILGGHLIWKEAKTWPLSSEERKYVLMMVFLGSVLGCIVPAFFAGEWLSERAMLGLVGPKTILGGLIGGFLMVAAYKKIFRIGYDTSDAFATGTALMMAVGRLGCHFGHCCFGKVVTTRFGVDMGDGLSRFPAALVESALLFGLFLVMKRLERSVSFKGKRLFVFFVLYGLVRFGMEQMREPLGVDYWGLRIYEWLALSLSAIGIFQIVKRSRVAVLTEEAA